MTMLGLLLLAILYLFCAFVCWRGVRNTPRQPVLGVLALVCMVVLGIAGWNSLQLLNLSMQAYAMGVDGSLNEAPGSVWAIGSLLVVVKYAPLWLLGRG